MCSSRGRSRGRPARGRAVGEFELLAQAVIVTSGGIGANHELVRKNWPKTVGRGSQEHDLRGARSRRRPDACDQRGRGREHRQPRPDVALHRGDPVTGTRSGAGHGIRILPGPSPLWLDATGKRLPVPLFPGFDTLGTLEHIIGKPAMTTHGSC